MSDKGYTRPTARSRELRADMTLAERRLWSVLRAHGVAGAWFNRQFPIGLFICDFVSRSARLVIEVDGGQHAVAEAADAGRTRYIESMGYRVIRFWNNEVIENLEGVVSAIERALVDTPSPSPSREREGNGPFPLPLAGGVGGGAVPKKP